MSLLCGPTLVLQQVDHASAEWTISAHIVVDQGTEAPPLTLKDSHNPTEVPAQLALKTERYGHYVYRFKRTLLDQQRFVSYSVGTLAKHELILPSRDPNSIRFMFFTCNGQQTKEDEEEAGGTPKYWEKWAGSQKKTPVHVLIGGGDQIYSDDVFFLPSVQAWVNQSWKARVVDKLSPTLEKEVSDFYESNYISHFSKDHLRKALASVVSVNSADDHDYFDGIGSYPPDLNQCPTMQGMKRIAQKWFLMYQSHHLQGQPTPYYFGKSSYSWLRNFGKVSVLGVDTRSERRKKQVVSPESWDLIFSKLETIPTSCRHLFVVLCIPIVFSDLGNIEKALALFGHESSVPDFVKDVMGKVTELTNQRNHFKEPALLDDLIDHWHSVHHKKERKGFIQRLQTLARAKNIRITFLGGDVHCGGFGYFRSRDINVPEGADHRYMPQIISSPMSNVCPPAAVITLFSHLAPKWELMDKNTYENMEGLLRTDDPAKNKVKNFFKHPNWTRLEVYGDDSINAVINVVKKDFNSAYKTFEKQIPPLAVSMALVPKSNKSSACAII